MPETRDTIAAWADEAFGPATDGARIGRAMEEAREAFEDIDGGSGLDEELADIVICLCAAPASAGLDVPALVGAWGWEKVEEKMAINRARKWTLRGDGNGDHVKE